MVLLHNNSQLYVAKLVKDTLEELKCIYYLIRFTFFFLFVLIDGIWFFKTIQGLKINYKDM